MKKKKINKVDIILLVVLTLLTILILFLGIKIYQQKKVHDNKYTDIIYVLKSNSRKNLQVDLSKIKKKQYVVKVANYNSKELSNDKITYTIEITNNTDGKMEIYKNKNKKGVITIPSKEKYILKDNRLEPNTKLVDTYYIKIKDLPNNSKNQQLDITVNS